MTKYKILWLSDDGYKTAVTSYNINSVLEVIEKEDLYEFKIEKIQVNDYED